MNKLRSLMQPTKRPSDRNYAGRHPAVRSMTKLPVKCLWHSFHTQHRPFSPITAEQSAQSRHSTSSTLYPITSTTSLCIIAAPTASIKTNAHRQLCVCQQRADDAITTAMVNRNNTDIACDVIVQVRKRVCTNFRKTING